MKKETPVVGSAKAFDLQSLNPQQLEQAFSLFNEASAQLAGAYQELQQKVEQLASELAIANGELRRQFLEKQALSQRLSSLLDALPGGVVVLDAEGRVVEANPVARRMLGEDMQGRAWHEIAAHSLGATPTPHEWILQRDGETRWVNLVESALYQEQGRILLISDITEANLMQQQLERHQRLSAMGEMAAGLAHQLRTPLATALLYTANLAKPQLAEDDRTRFAEKALARLHHLERMIRDMLLFVKGESAEQEDIPVAALVHELVQVMEPQMAQHGVAFSVEGEVDGVVQGSRKALVGALLNLLENAMQACGGAGEVRLLAARAGSGAVTLTVSDTGCGIDAATKERLFQPFFTTRSEGTGLGLAIVRSVIQTHGGEIAVHSQLGAGSQFVVRLPCTGCRDEVMNS
ncbi:MAG: ATP-binding protein [Pseudomonadota bacterium]